MLFLQSTIGESTRGNPLGRSAVFYTLAHLVRNPSVCLAHFAHGIMAFPTYPLKVWEMGVHASLSAEPLQMWARSLPVKLRHRNLIREQYPQWLPQKCETRTHL